MDNYKIEFEDFDKTKFNGYSRLHYGTLKVDKLKFPFVVYEVYLSKVNYHTFSMNFTESIPDKQKEFGSLIIEQTKNKLNLVKK
jgi:hypothetical protein